MDDVTGRGYRRAMRTLLTLTILAAACGTAPGGDDDHQVDAAERGTTELVACSAEYTSRHRNGVNTAVVTEIYAELPTDLVAGDLARVTAVVCDLVEQPPPSACPAGDTCVAPPAKTCVLAGTSITEDGRIAAYCGQRGESRGPNNELLGTSVRKYLSATFHIAPPPS